MWYPKWALNVYIDIDCITLGPKVGHSGVPSIEHHRSLGKKGPIKGVRSRRYVSRTFVRLLSRTAARKVLLYAACEQPSVVVCDTIPPRMMYKVDR